MVALLRDDDEALLPRGSFFGEYYDRRGCLVAVLVTRAGPA
jgi:hypothetical protein